MKKNMAGRLALMLLAAITVAACGQKADTPVADKAKADVHAKAAADAAAASAAKEKEGLEAGVEAVAYGFQLVIMDATWKKISNVATAGPSAAPVNPFAHMPQFPDASFKDVVRANIDTLYSSAWLDLSKEPIVLSVPDTQGRYYLMPMLDAWIQPPKHGIPGCYEKPFGPVRVATFRSKDVSFRREVRVSFRTALTAA